MSRTRCSLLPILFLLLLIQPSLTASGGITVGGGRPLNGCNRHGDISKLPCSSVSPVKPPCDDPRRC